MNFQLNEKQKIYALKTLKGYREADKFITGERKINLPCLGLEEGLAQFNDLYNFYEMTQKVGLENLENPGMEDFMTLRKRLNTLGRRKSE